MASHVDMISCKEPGFGIGPQWFRKEGTEKPLRRLLAPETAAYLDHVVLYVNGLVFGASLHGRRTRRKERRIFLPLSFLLEF